MRLLSNILGAIWVGLLLFFGVILSPALILSRKFREMYFVAGFRVAIFLYGDAMAPARRAALKPLETLESHDTSLRSEECIRVLEIGAGSGANFEHITRKIKYTNVDPNEEFGKAFLSQLRNHPKIEMERWVHCAGENMDKLDDEQFDVVLLTYVLCSVQDGRKVLEEAKRVLVKGGRMIFLEHVGFPKGTWLRLLQDIITPLWRIIAADCRVNRDSEKLIQEAGFSNVTTNYIDVDMCFLLSRQVYGVATP